MATREKCLQVAYGLEIERYLKVSEKHDDIITLRKMELASFDEVETKVIYIIFPTAVMC